MNLINLFQNTIAEMGMKILEHPIFYKAPVGIRFEIGGEDDVYIKKGITKKLYPNPTYVNNAVERASRILNALPKKGWILRIDLYDEKEVKKIFKALQLVPSHEKVLNEYEDNGEKMTLYELYWSLDDIDWSEETIIREIVLADIGGLNCLASVVYLVHPKEKILYHLYDDRGLDLVAKDKNKLHPLYETFNDWILDEDREAIDSIFKDEDDAFKLNYLLEILNKLEEKNIYYQLNKIRKEAIMVEIALPGQRWEIEFLDDGTVDVEKFISDKDFYDESELDLLFKRFND
ncbi:MAG TPA: DUF3885 domain-containing protein [Candidatus Dormibacteraeota bacterium]|nr:DUF3885 domain-containing protein [Candidatus Dormibacteraeota bacterium]